MVAIVQRGSALGLDPHSSLESIYVVSGKTALLTDLMHALVEKTGLIEDKHHEFKGVGDQRTCTVTMKRINRTAQPYSYSLAQAKEAGIAKFGGGWTKYLDSMLYARAMAFALRREFPEVLKGIHSFEELYVEQEPQPLKVVQPEPETPEEREIKPVVKRHRRTKAEMLAAKESKPLIEVPAKEEPAISTPPAPEPDIDKAIPAKVTVYDEIKVKAFNSAVSNDEVLAAAKVLRLAFEETSLDQIPEHKVRTLTHHWPAVLGQISREKVKNGKN